MGDTNMTKQERVRKYGEVFTPQQCVEMMCDMLSENSDIAPWEPGVTFLEPSCGEGVFILEVLRRKFKRCKTRKDFETAALSIWAIEIQPDNVQKTINAVLRLCREHFSVSKALEREISDHIIMGDALKIMKLLRRQNQTGGHMEPKNIAALMMSADYKERFKGEYWFVKNKLDGLTALLEKWDAGKLDFTPTCPRSIYDVQARAMRDYCAILELRAVAEGVTLGGSGNVSS